MNSLQRIYQLLRILASRTLPVSHQVLEERLECSRATVNRTNKRPRGKTTGY